MKENVESIYITLTEKKIPFKYVTKIYLQEIYLFFQKYIVYYKKGLELNALKKY